jgi:pentatricopeptide repeat protein
MRPALTLSTRRAKSSQCLFKQCRFEVENHKRSFLTCSLTSKVQTSARPQLPVLWFLVTRSITLKALKEESDATNRKFHPRSMTKDVDLDSLFGFLAASSLTQKEIFKSLRTALYNTNPYDAEKAWLIYQNMVEYQVDKYLKPNQYGFLLGILKYGDSVSRMLTVLENMKSNDTVYPSAYHISQVLFAMSRQGLVREACDLIRVTTVAAQTSGLFPTSNHYHSLAMALKNTKLRDPAILQQVTKLMMEAMQRNTELDSTTLSTMISLLSKRRHPSATDDDLTLQFLLTMDKFNASKPTHPYNVYIYTSLISGFARKGDSISAKRLFDQMQKHNVEPNQVTFAAMIDAYGKAGDFDGAADILKQHQKRYRKVTNPLVTSLLVNAIHHNNLKVAQKTADMVHQKMKPEEIDTMLRTALLWLKTKQDIDGAREMFESLYQKNTANSIMVNHLLLGYSGKKDKKSVAEMYSRHKDVQVIDDERSKHYLANALFQCRDVPAAIAVYASMRSQAIPDDITTAMIIRGLVMNNEGNIAWKLFKTLQYDGIELNLRAYTSILKALGHRESDLKKKDPTPISADALIAAGIRSNADYLQSPPTTEALNLFRRMTGFEQPNVYTYTTLISCFAKYDIKRAISIFDHMCQKQVRPTVETYTAILQGCAIFRNSQMALTVFNHMCENRIEPNQVTWRYLLKSLLRSRVDKSQIDKIGAMARKSLEKSRSSSNSSSSSSSSSSNKPNRKSS